MILKTSEFNIIKSISTSCVNDNKHFQKNIGVRFVFLEGVNFPKFPFFEMKKISIIFIPKMNFSASGICNYYILPKYEWRQREVDFVILEKKLIYIYVYIY